MGSANRGARTELRIGELARLAGTTTRTVRHYHQVGLLDEPSRDASGYRRYGAGHLIRLVRIRRLRMLDMPLEHVAAHLSGDADEPSDLQASLRALAADVERQIEELELLRGRILDLASSGRLAAPLETWEAALRLHGLLAGADGVAPDEREAIELLDVLHPDGVSGVVAQSSPLLSQPGLTERLGDLLERFRALADDAEAIEQLAVELAETLPRPAQPAPAVDVRVMDRLLGHRFSPAQRRVLHRLRELLDESGR